MGQPSQPRVDLSCRLWLELGLGPLQTENRSHRLPGPSSILQPHKDTAEGLVPHERGPLHHKPFPQMCGRLGLPQTLPIQVFRTDRLLGNNLSSWNMLPTKNVSVHADS